MDETSDLVDTYQFARREGLTPTEAFGRIKDDLSAIYEEQGWTFLRTATATLIDACAETTAEAEVLIDGFFDITTGGGDIIGEEDADWIEDLVRRFPDSMQFVDILAGFYADLCGQGHTDTCLPRLNQCVSDHPDMSSVALYYAYALVDLVWDVDKGTVSPQGYANAIQQVKGLYEAHPYEEFAERYAKGLKNLVAMQDREEDAVQLIDVIDNLLAQWPNKYIASDYLSALTRLTWLQDERGCAATIAKMESLWDGYPYSLQTLAMNMAYACANYSLCVSDDDKNAVLQRISELSTWWQPAARMASELRSGTYLYAHKPMKAA